MSISHDEGFDESVVVLREEEQENNVLQLQLATRDETIPLPLPPLLGDLAGCSPSYLACTSPAFTFRDAAELMDNSVSIENEIQTTRSRRSSSNFQIPELQYSSPSKSQLSDLVRSIGTPDVSLASTSASSVTSSPKRHSSIIGDEVSRRLRNILMPAVDRLKSGELSGYDGPEIIYTPDNNLGSRMVNDEIREPSPNNKKISAASVFPLATGLAVVREAFGPKLTPAMSETNSLAATPTPGDGPLGDELAAKNSSMQNGGAGTGSNDNELDPETLFFRYFLE